MNRTLILTVISGCMLFMLIALFTSKVSSRIKKDKATPIFEEFVQIYPDEEKPEFKPKVNEWTKIIDVAPNSILIPNATITFVKGTTETWLLSNDNNLICGLFYEESSVNRALAEGTELKVEWAKSNIKGLPGNRNTGTKEECVLKCSTEGGMKIYVLLIAGANCEVANMPGTYKKKWSALKAHSPTVGEANKFWTIISPPTEPVKVPWIEN